LDSRFDGAASMSDPPDDPVFGFFRCRVCGSETVALKSDAARYLTLEFIPECCGQTVQLLGAHQTTLQEPPLPDDRPKPN
jgi:hypothetical protein